MTHISSTELRMRLAHYLDEVCDSRDALVVTRQKAGDVVMMSADEYNSIMETLHLLRSPANAAALLQGIKDLDDGKGVEFDPTR
jgi:antitoxin YefM